MKYRLTETEKNTPSYKYSEEFDTREEAQARMHELYKAYYEEPAVDKAEIFANSAILNLNDGNTIEWDIAEID